KKGRLWSYNWSIFAVNDFGFPNRPFNGAFYVCAPDPDDKGSAFITKIDFNGAGFQPAAFNVAFNSFGIQNTGDVNTDRKSVENLNATQSEYEIFLNDPVELCRTAVVGEIALIGISRCSDEAYCIKFITTKEGQVDLLLDFDGGDDIYTPGTADVILVQDVDSAQVGIPTCIYWDGLDGLGNPLVESNTTQVPITISYAQGIYHFPIYDAEFMNVGFMLEAVRPAASIPLLHYDDSNISVTSLSGEPAVQISGCTVPCHRWNRFVDNTVPGFGNLHTINSWWFSQRIVRQEVFFLPAYYACAIDGPQRICNGEVTQILINPSVSPAGAIGGEVISTIWSGPGIVGSNEGLAITIGEEGDYAVTLSWINGVGDTCQTSCEYHLNMDPPLSSSIDTLILQGDVININGELYAEGGTYTQVLSAINGCDSTLTIFVKVINSIIHYDLEACFSHTDDGSNMDYSEFTATQPEPLSCADITATIFHRDPPQMNKHSCTEGVNGTIAMCISAQDTCKYDAGNQSSLFFEISIVPDADTAVQVTGFSFFDKGPLTYNWINGSSGPNNYPTLFGFRVLKNGIEIFRQEGIATTTNWTARSFDFKTIDDFITAEPATFRFELLPYCLVGNGATVAAWDIDEVNVQASCVSPNELNKFITGIIRSPLGEPVRDVLITYSQDPSFQTVETMVTNASGKYKFDNLTTGSPAYIKGYKNTDVMLGVTTLDLIRVQKHLLSRQPFTSPYQYVAADVNKSNAISALDLIVMKKIILGITSVFPNNTSYRIGVSDASWNGSFPFGFKESLDYESLSRDIRDGHMVAVKIGDVTGSGSGIGSDGIITRSEKTLNFAFDNVLLKRGVLVAIPVRAQNFTDISGFQLAISSQESVIENIYNGALDIPSDQYLLTDNGVLISWFDVDANSFNEDEVLFTVTVVPETDMFVSEIFSINTSSMKDEAYRGSNLAIADIDFVFTTSKANVSGDVLFQNLPNPLSSLTTIPFSLSKAGEAIIRIFDMSGRLVSKISNVYPAGYNVVEINAVDLGDASGMLLYQLNTDNFTSVKRMMRLKL
ncbi:MAG: T9SS type A sorting domain-containing protein, partial [Bacteroidota bacterium]|nr:T9SS type A sorting domain-containing protein [Bacteroidota bacterium]